VPIKENITMNILNKRDYGHGGTTTDILKRSKNRVGDTINHIENTDSKFGRRIILSSKLGQFNG
jgi:hypothetical protein